MLKTIPSLQEVEQLAKQGNIVPIYCEVVADMETPVSAFLKIAQGDYSFLLESVEGSERFARYSFLGTLPYKVVTTTSDDALDPLLEIEAELQKFQVVNLPNLPRFHGGAVGYLAYEVARYYEKKLPMPPIDPVGLPESVFMFIDTLLVFDHLFHQIKVVSHVRLDGDIQTSYSRAVKKIETIVRKLQSPLPYFPYDRSIFSRQDEEASFTSNMSEEKFKEKVVKAKEYITKGDTYQIQVSQRFARKTFAPAFEIYRSLRTLNPSPYMYFLHLKDFDIIGASPEMLIRIEEDQIETHPIAGTRRRGKNPEDEVRMAEELQTSEKERAEHVMLVDLARNDLGRVCVPGTVKVTELMQIEKYSHVMHLVSHVVGKLREDVSIFQALRAYFPHGTVTGAPKIRTMEIIAELEGQKRGGYGGTVGYFDLSGNCDTALAIRTIWMKDETCYIQAAGGVVYDSTPEEEYLESQNKARGALRSIELAEERIRDYQPGSLGYE